MLTIKKRLAFRSNFRPRIREPTPGITTRRVPLQGQGFAQRWKAEGPPVPALSFTSSPCCERKGRCPRALKLLQGLYLGAQVVRCLFYLGTYLLSCRPHRRTSSPRKKRRLACSSSTALARTHPGRHLIRSNSGTSRSTAPRPKCLNGGKHHRVSPPDS